MTRTLTPEQIERLQVVPARPGLDLTCFPDFMVIGPQRTGSTWLHRNLDRHRQVFISDPKEIYYFSSVQWPDKHPEGLPPIETDLEWYLRFFDRPAARAKGIRVRGEATASYAVAVSDAVMDDIRLLNPDLKILMFVRHPGQRGWSHLKKFLSLDRDRPVRDITVEDCRQFFANPYNLGCGLFSRIIPRWQAKFGEDQVFVRDFRDIKRRPDELLREVFEFLDVDPNVDTEGVKTRKIASTPKGDMPGEIRAYFDELYGEELKALAAMGYTWD